MLTHMLGAGVISLTLLCFCASGWEGSKNAPSSPIPPSLLPALYLPAALVTKLTMFSFYFSLISRTVTWIPEDRDLMSVSPQPRTVPGKQW